MPETTIELDKPLDVILEEQHVKKFLEGLQGNILKGHGRKYTAHLLVRFDPRFRKTARTWLANFAKHKVISAYEQREQAEGYRKNRNLQELFAMILVSAAGYRALRIHERQIPKDKDSIFKSGMQTSELNPKDKTHRWDEFYKSDVHAMILLAHEDPRDLETEVRSTHRQLARFCEAIQLEEGKKKINKLGDLTENFGYVDGISQPWILIEEEVSKKTADPSEKASEEMANPPEKASEETANPPEEVSEETANPPEKASKETTDQQNQKQTKWTSKARLDILLVPEPKSNKASDKNVTTFGSFMVFRKLEQNQVNFRSLLATTADTLRLSQQGTSKPTPEEKAWAHLMGRYEDGRPWFDPSPRDKKDEKPICDDFKFDGPESKPTPCPAHAHIRKANPRNTESAKIVRRGIPYDYNGQRIQLMGTAQATSSASAKIYNNNAQHIRLLRERQPEMGLLFMSFQSDIEEFEKIQMRADSAENSGSDPIIGRSDAHDVVILRGGEYFFAPSIPMLEALAESVTLSPSQIEHFKNAARGLLQKKDTLRMMGDYWKLDDYIRAVEKAGINAEDFDDFYAYLLPSYFPLLDKMNNYNLQPGDPSISDLALEEVTSIEGAFALLLKPEKLDEFATHWKNDEKAQAFSVINLNDREASLHNLYMYLKQFDIQLDLIMWG